MKQLLCIFLFLLCTNFASSAELVSSEHVDLPASAGLLRDQGPGVEASNAPATIAPPAGGDFFSRSPEESSDSKKPDALSLVISACTKGTCSKEIIKKTQFIGLPVGQVYERTFKTDQGDVVVTISKTGSESVHFTIVPETAKLSFADIASVLPQSVSGSELRLNNFYYKDGQGMDVRLPAGDSGLMYIEPTGKTH
jgi:hypothetical protein